MPGHSDRVYGQAGVAREEPPGGNEAAPDLSVITVTCNSSDVIGACLQSVRGNHIGGLRLEHIVVDNASADGTLDTVREYGPEVRTIANSVNVGYGRAHNQVLDICAGRYVVTVNPDVVLHPGALPALVEFMDRHPDVGVAGPRCLAADGTPQRTAFHLPSPGAAALRRARRALGRESAPEVARAGEPVDTGWLAGAVCIYRRAAIEAVGFFDPVFFLYSEETDLHLRLGRGGWRVVYLPAATATHLGGRSAERQLQLANFHHAYSRLLFARKHGPYWWYVLLTGSLVARALYISKLCPARRLRALQPAGEPAELRRTYERLLASSLRLLTGAGPCPDPLAMPDGGTGGPWPRP